MCPTWRENAAGEGSANRVSTPKSDTQKRDPAKLDRFRAEALALPGSSEQDHFGRPSFRVGKKIFATLWVKEGWAMVKLTPAQQKLWAVAHPELIWPVDGAWGAKGATLIKVAGRPAVTLVDMRSLLLLAWKNTAPRSLLAEFGGE